MADLTAYTDPLLDGGPVRPREILRGSRDESEVAIWEAERRRYRDVTPSERARVVAEAWVRLRDGETVRQICLLPHMPPRSVLWEWLNFPEYRDETHAAMEAQLDLYRLEIVDIAEDGTNDWMEIESERTGRTSIVPNKEHMMRSKLRIETRQWLLTKLRPGTYGERTTIQMEVKTLAPDAASQRAALALNRLELLMQAKPANDAAVALPLVERVGS